MSNQEQMVKLMKETTEVVTVNPKSKTKQGATMLSPREKELEQLKGELSEAKASLNQLYEKIKNTLKTLDDIMADFEFQSCYGQDAVVEALGDQLFEGFALTREYRRLHELELSCLEKQISLLEDMPDDEYVGLPWE
jgi:DNA repair ATPase RecN